MHNRKLIALLNLICTLYLLIFEFQIVQTNCTFPCLILQILSNKNIQILIKFSCASEALNNEPNSCEKITRV